MFSTVQKNLDRKRVCKTSDNHQAWSTAGTASLLLVEKRETVLLVHLSPGVIKWVKVVVVVGEGGWMVAAKVFVVGSYHHQKYPSSQHRQQQSSRGSRTVNSHPEEGGGGDFPGVNCRNG